MPRIDEVGTSRALTSVYWLGIGLVAQSWRAPFTAVANVLRRHRFGGRNVRMSSVSQEWLRHYEKDHAKRGSQ